MESCSFDFVLDHLEREKLKVFDNVELSDQELKNLFYL